MELRHAGYAAGTSRLYLLRTGGMLGEWTMEKEFPYLVPAGSARAHFYYPIGTWTMDNGANGGSH